MKTHQYPISKRSSQVILSGNGRRPTFRAFGLVAFVLLVLGWSGGLAAQTGYPLALTDHALDRERGNVWAFKISSDGGTVVYKASAAEAIFYSLYAVPVVGGESVKLSGTVDVDNFELSTDGSRVVFTSPGTDGNLYSVPLSGGPAVKLNRQLAEGGRVWSFCLTSDGGTVVYTAEQDVDGLIELYSVPIDGGGTTQLSLPLASGGTVAEYVLNPEGTVVVYRARMDWTSPTELYAVPVGGGASVKLNGAIVAGGSVSSEFAVSPDGQSVLYIADQDTAGINELYSVPLDGSASPRKLNDPLAAGGWVTFASVRIPPRWCSVRTRAAAPKQTCSAFPSREVP